MRIIIDTPIRTAIAGALICLYTFTNISIVHAAKPGHPRVVIAQAEQGAIVDEIRLSGTVSSPRVARLAA